jgi:cell fate (sporulation/competence/biofilm development) regulator YmcA (YheA/YmcA/DUF963 family)
MNKLDSLISHLEDNELITRAKMLKAIIEKDADLLARFQKLLAHQKAFVQLEYAQSEHAKIARSQYQETLDSFLDTPIVSEYLVTIEEINDLVQTLVHIINSSINAVDTE